MQIKRERIFALLSIFCILLLIRNLLVLKSIQPSGYNVDIYTLFSFDFYMTFIFCYFIASVLVLNWNSKVGYYILCLNHLEILLIPYMLGYYSMGRADDMSYIGEYLQISTSGHFAQWDIYPASHTIGAAMALLSGIEAHYISFIIPVVFSFIFIIGICLLSKELISQPNLYSLVTVSSFILYMGIYNFLNVPHALFFALLPLYLSVFYKYTKSFKNVAISIIFVLMTLLIPITHPFIVFFMLSFFLLHMVPKTTLKPYAKLLDNNRVKVSSFLVLVFAFMSWFIYNSKLTGYFKASYLAFINKITEPVFFGATEKLAKINLDILDYLQLIGFFYGRYLIPTIFIFISLFIIYTQKKSLKKAQIKEYSYLFILYFIFLFIQVILLFNPLIVHQPDRITNLNFIAYIQVPLFSIALYFIFLQKKPTFNRAFQVSLILTFVWTLSFFGCFDSPDICKTNAALTYNEVHGMDWFYSLKGDLNVSVPLSQLNRFHDLFGNPEKTDKLNYLPDHFGYSNGTGFFANSDLDTASTSYVIILTIDELLYQKVKGYEQVGRYTNSDFVKFRKDTSVSKIYDSTNIEIFKFLT